ncbi:MAG TPA: proprotein convertase P-domain-containing protein [Phycisphaerales bacterium]|nr:proprotein convertase P-domain-containing protein [Phycisphaerales bacterium]
MKQLIVPSIVALGLALPASAVVQTYNGTGGAIGDNNGLTGGTNFIINIGDSGVINSIVNVTMTFSTAHTWAGDLEVTLIAPNLDDCHIFSRPGVTASTGVGNSANLLGPYTFVNSGGANFATAVAGTAGTANVASGTYNRSTAAAPTVTGGQDPDDYSVFAGDNLNGAWTLNIADWASLDTGALGSWSITIDYSGVPAPGALALLGLAGVVGRRRRNA